MDDQTMQTITTDVEKDLLAAIIENLKENSLQVEQARALAREFLALLPMEDKRDLLDKLYKFSQEHAETKDIYLKYAKPFEEEDRQQKLALMSEHIKNGRIEHAISVAKGEAAPPNLTMPTITQPQQATPASAGAINETSESEVPKQQAGIAPSDK